MSNQVASLTKQDKSLYVTRGSSLCLYHHHHHHHQQQQQQQQLQQQQQQQHHQQQQQQQQQPEEEEEEEEAQPQRQPQPQHKNCNPNHNHNRSHSNYISKVCPNTLNLPTTLSQLFTYRAIKSSHTSVSVSLIGEGYILRVQQNAILNGFLQDSLCKAHIGIACQHQGFQPFRDQIHFVDVVWGQIQEHQRSAQIGQIEGRLFALALNQNSLRNLSGETTTCSPDAVQMGTTH